MVIEFFYHHASPPCQAVWMVLENLGIEYKPVLVDLFTGEQTKDEYAAINPVKQVPAIKDGDFKLAQSRAIATYLCNKYEPKDKKEKLCPTDDVKVIAKFNSILMRDIDNYHTMDRFIDGENVYTEQGSGPIPQLLPKALAVLQEVDDMVSNCTYVFGDHVTILDFFVLETVLAAEIGGVEVWKTYKNLDKWRAALTKLPGFEKCVGRYIQYNIDLYQELCKAFTEKNK